MNSNVLTGQVGGSCTFCMTSIGGCIDESLGGMSTCVPGDSRRWATSTACYGGLDSNRCDAGAPTPSPPTVYSGWYYSSCEQGCTFLSNSTSPVAYSSQDSCDTARLNECPFLCESYSAMCMCDLGTSTLNCGAAPAGIAAACSGRTCNPCTGPEAAGRACTINGSTATVAMLSGQSHGGVCGYFDQRNQAWCCMSDAVYPAGTPITCSQGGDQCLNAGINVITNSSVQTGTCRTICENATNPQCQLAGNGGVYTGGSVANGGICELTASGNCCLNPGDTTTYASTGTLPCATSGYECLPAQDGVKRCQLPGGTTPNQCQLVNENGSPAAMYNGEVIPIGSICQLVNPACNVNGVSSTGVVCTTNSTCMVPPGGGVQRCVANQCFNTTTPLCGSMPMTSGPGGTCGLGESCCTAIGTMSTDDVTCDNPTQYHCVNSVCSPRNSSSSSSSSSSTPAWCCMNNVPRGYGNCAEVRQNSAPNF